MSDQALLLNRSAMQALAGRRLTEAQQLLSQALQLDPTYLSAWLNLATARRMDGDLAGAMQAVDAARRVDPLCFPALLMRGSLFEAMGKPRLAALGYNIALTQMLPEDCRDEATRRAVDHARRFYDSYRRERESTLREALSTDAQAGGSLAAQRMAGFLDHLLGRAAPSPPASLRYPSRPTNFCYPGLPTSEFHDRAHFPWLDELEAATPQIQAELAAVFADETSSADIEPYTQRPTTEPPEQWGELNHSLRWSAYHFANHGLPFPAHRAKCAVTASLLDRMKQPRVAHHSPAALFSILRPKTQIPPHHGVANYRLLCHLPLVVPPDCRIRVGGTIRGWQIGEAFIFDDTIEHEAWNDSDQLRTVLIFDLWHPLLEPEEQDFIARAVEASDRFNTME